MRPVRIDTVAPNVARVWNYLVGGRDNFEADRRAAKLLISVAPAMAEVGPASRAFLRRTVTYLAAEAGIRQFLDVGTGMPTAGNTHEVAQAVDPACRVVYVDNDPVVLSHARALLRSAEGGVSFLDADARDPASVIAGRPRRSTSPQPVGVVMIDILNFLEDADGRARRAGRGGAVRQLPGRHAADAGRRLLAIAGERWNHISPIPVILGTAATVERWFTDLGLDLVEPGLVSCTAGVRSPEDPDCSDTLAPARSRRPQALGSSRN